MEDNCTSIENMKLENHPKMIELLQEELHKTKSTLARRDLIVTEMHADIEILQTQLKQENSKTIEAVKVKEIQLTEQFNLRVNNLQTLFDEEKGLLMKTIDEANEKIKSFENTFQSKSNFDESNYNLMEENISILSAEISDLKEKLSQSKFSLEAFQKENRDLKEKVAFLEENLREKNEVLQHKNELLQTTTNAIQDIQCENALLANELSSLKAGPIGELHRGNSLFAEVDDKRQLLESKLEAMQKKIIQLKKIIVMKTSENENLKTENTRLLHHWQYEEKDSQKELKELVETYKKSVEELQELVHNLEQRPESPQVVTVSDTDVSQLQWVHAFIAQERAEARELRRKLHNRAVQHALEGNQLYLLQQESRNLKRQGMKDAGVIKDLEMQAAKDNEFIKELQMQAAKNEELIKQLKIQLAAETNSENIPENTENSKTIRFADDVKDNEGFTKKKRIEEEDSNIP